MVINKSKSGLIYWLMLFFLFLPFTLHAEIKVVASINPTQATLEDDLELTITITGSSSVSEPRFASVPSFKIIPQGTSSNIQIINGSMSLSKSFSYVLIPQAKGDFTLPPVEVESGGKVFKSNPVQVSITGFAPNQAQTSPGIDPVDPYTAAQRLPQNSNNANQYQSDAPYWVEAGISNNNPYLNEQIIYTFRFYTSVNVGTATLSLPEFKDFAVEELVPEKKGYQTINGRRFVVSEKTLALFPIKTGPLSIEPSSLRVEVADDQSNPINDPFFFGLGRTRLKVKNLNSKPLSLEVRSLPTPDPNSHFTGLVGTFQVEKSASASEVTQGDSISYEIILKGRGNIKDAYLEAFPSVNGLKVYEDNPILNIIRKESGIEGEKKFKRALVPTMAGTYEIPEMSLSYFDPENGAYKALLIPKTSIVARASQTQENLNQAGGTQNSKESSVKEPEKDEPSLKPLKTNLKDDLSESINTLSIIFYILGPLVFLFVFLLKRNPLRHKSTSLKKPIQQFKSQVLKVPQENRQEWAKDILTLLKTYFERRFHVTGMALTPVEMARLFDQAGISKDLCLRFEHMLRELESLVYQPASDVSFNLQEFCDHLELLDQKMRIRS